MKTQYQNLLRINGRPSTTETNRSKYLRSLSLKVLQNTDKGYMKTKLRYNINNKVTRNNDQKSNEKLQYKDNLLIIKSLANKEIRRNNRKSNKKVVKIKMKQICLINGFNQIYK